MGEHQFTERMKLSATLASELNQESPVIMAGDPAEKISKVSRLGYRAIELHWADPAKIPLSEILAACEKNNMEISAFATGKAYVQEGLCLIHDDENIKVATIQRLLRFVDTASRCGAIVIIGCIRGNLPAGKPQAPYLQRLAQSVRLVAEYAEERNVGIVLEAINRYENNYLNTARETGCFIRENGLPNTKILLDSFHMNIEETSLPEAIISFGDQLGYIHIADSNRQYAGAGHIDFKEVASALNTINYQGYISAECLPLPDSDTALVNWIKGVTEVF